MVVGDLQMGDEVGSRLESPGTKIFLSQRLMQGPIHLGEAGKIPRVLQGGPPASYKWSYNFYK